MFIQIHMLQSMPPGNLNRDETGQPKKCVFGGVTRGRISSQCLKRNIRHSEQFKEAFGDALGDRTKYLPRMVADVLRAENFGVPGEDLESVMTAIAKEFSGKEKAEGIGITPQLVFFPQPYARRIAELIGKLRSDRQPAYRYLLWGEIPAEKLSESDKEEAGKVDDEFKARTKTLKAAKKDANNDSEKQAIEVKEKELKAEKEAVKEKRKKESDNREAGLKAAVEEFVKSAFDASNALTVDIGLFGRMTTSDLVVNVEAACQVAHAISTHETLIEGDWFTAMDDRKADFAVTQSDLAGAAHIGSGEDMTFFNSAVYYKYLNLDLTALRKHLPALSDAEAAHAAGTLLSAAALVNPTGKQNSFAAHSVPELVLVEVSKKKRPLSYANAFLQPVEGGMGRNLMTESAKALQGYIDSVAAAFAPSDTRRVLLAVGPASVSLGVAHEAKGTLDGLVEAVEKLLTAPAQSGASA